MTGLDPCERKDPHATEALAATAGQLHVLATNGNCPAVNAYPCGDHWHWGHLTPIAGDRCKTQNELPRRRRQTDWRENR